MSTHTDATALLVPATFADQSAAEEAIAALRAIGIAEEDIGVVVAAPAAAPARDDAGGDVLAGAGKGASFGAPLGALGGLSLLAMSVGGIAAIGVGGLLAVGSGGLLWGGVIGGLVGVITRVRRQPDADRWAEIELEPGAVELVVRVRDWAREGEIAEVLKRHGAREVLDELESDHTWRELEAAHPSGQPAPTG